MIRAIRRRSHTYKDPSRPVRLRSIVVITASALVALAVWPTVIAHRLPAPAAAVTPAPVNRDYIRRDAIIAFQEKQTRLNSNDQITARLLASQYMERFREQGDVGDIARAQAMAQRSLRLQPQGNTGAQMALASALLTYHNFRGALTHEQDAIDGEPFNDSARAQKASLLMELGRYEEAHTILAVPPKGPENPTWDSVVARYDEETGHLGRARRLMEHATQLIDGLTYTPAYSRSWFHMRLAQLAFEAGDDATAQKEFDTSLSLFPDNSMALMFQARLYRSEKRWHKTLASATRGADIYPLPQTLGYKADAQRALGLSDRAKQTDELIRAEERLFNVQGINDRLLANYYAQRHTFLPDALHGAFADYRKRGNEIYADDTMAWVLAQMGHWRQARPYAEEAARFNTQDSVLEYHTAIVALHTGHPNEARRRLRMALQLNPQFHPVYAQDARVQLARLQQ
jgi:tetratricopeptide (TPR) repeat protein